MYITNLSVNSKQHYMYYSAECTEIHTYKEMFEFKFNMTFH